MAIKKISREEIAEHSVERLAKRPNLRGRFGRSGLTADGLRRAFDELALIAINKINEIIEYLELNGAASGGDSEISESLTEMLKSKADKNHTHDDRYYSATALDFLLETYLKKSPDGTNSLIGEDGKIASMYIPSVGAANAETTSLADEGGYYEASEVEGALAEIGALLSELDEVLGKI